MKNTLRFAFIVIPCTIAATVAAIAAETTPPPAAATAPSETPPRGDGSEVQKITITGSRLNETDQRRLSTASKLIVGRDELDRNGDSTVGEILKRLPGVTIAGRPGRGGDIRMRGLGSGYTQVLLNGERPPRGFSLDTLSPDQVERIEVIRGPVAEFSTQAIAGTINIILREGYKQPQTQWRITDAMEQGSHDPSVSVTTSGDVGALSYVLSGSVYQTWQQDNSRTANLSLDASGATTEDQQVIDHTRRRTTGVHLSPRLSYRFDSGDTLVLQPFVTSSRSTGSGGSQLLETIGIAPYASATTSSTADNTVARAFGNWQHKIDGGGQLNIKFGAGLGKNDSDSRRYQFDARQSLLNDYLDTSETRDSSASTGGKLTLPYGEGHTIALGWDAEWGRRTQNRVSLDKGLPRFDDSGEDLSAQTRRFDGFVQDEWDINKQWSAYAGLRWEGIRTVSDTAAGDLTNSSSVWSPVLHGVWRIPDSRDQVRMSLTHSYRAPSLADLIALPSLSNVNKASSPDRIGNPDLKPELAAGVDLAFEHYLSRSGLMSVNLFRRDIRDLMRRVVALQNTPNGMRWVSQPFNIGRATTSGLELELKAQLVEFFPDAPAIDLRANYSRFWSTVDAVPGPNNRLDQQPGQTGNLGIDYRLADTPLTLGGNVNWTPAYQVRSSDAQIVSAGLKRQVDIYGLWKLSPTAQLRLSANNLLADDYLTGSSFSTAGLSEQSSVAAQTYTLWSLKLELKI